MTALPPLISLQSVSRTYRADGVAVTAVRNVSFDIERGEIVAVMGPSGSGKSTLMNMIGLLDLPSEGALYLEGSDVADLSEDRRSSLRARSIGFVFQSYNLLARHNAIENVALPLVYCGISRKERLARAEQSLEAVGMVHRAHHFPPAALGRRAAARRDRARTDRLPADRARRRADRRARQPYRRRDTGPVRRAQPDRPDHRDDHA
ncbi:ABC-type lipoprotein export system ATPase subunit [Bradyrhizobium sp. F1.13.4]